MSAIRSKGNKSTESKLLGMMKLVGIKGWRRHNKLIIGKPDFSFTNSKLTVFIDGCFWHGCTTCYKAPASNTEFWDTKISYNKQRDNKVNTVLKMRGWKVLRIWEHELRREPNEVIEKIVTAL